MDGTLGAMPLPGGPVPDRLDDLLDELTAVVTDAADRRSRTGYFAAVYRTVTAAVRRGITEGLFDDAERMERLDVVFARRYLDALEVRRAGRATTRSWEVALDAAGRWRPIVLQHLVVGMNAHINLDLGIAAAVTAPGDELPALRRDFDRINGILGAQLDRVQAALGAISPWLELLDWVGGASDEEVLRFSLERARAGAWWFATELAALPRDAWAGPIGSRDLITAGVGRGVVEPGLLQPVLLAVRARESDDVARNIRLLADLPQPSLRAVERRTRGGGVPGE